MITPTQINIPEDIQGQNPCVQGDTFLGLTMKFKVTDSDPVAYHDITNWDFLFQIRRKPNSNSELLYEGTVGSGLTKSDAVNGELTLDKFSIDFGYGTFWYELELTTDEGDVITAFRGSFIVPNEIAKS